MKRILALSLAALAIGVALAAGLQSYTAAWVAPTQDANGNALTGAVTYQVYAGAPGSEVAYGSPVSTLSLAGIVPSTPGAFCVVVTSIVNGLESDKPGEVCVIVPAPPVVAVKPKPPTGITLK